MPSDRKCASQRCDRCGRSSAIPAERGWAVQSGTMHARRPSVRRAGSSLGRPRALTGFRPAAAGGEGEGAARICVLRSASEDFWNLWIARSQGCAAQLLKSRVTALRDGKEQEKDSTN